jgi:hypothetical protein
MDGFAMKLFDSMENKQLHVILDFVEKVQSVYGLRCTFHSVYGSYRGTQVIHELIIEAITVSKGRELKDIVESIVSIQEMLDKRVVDRRVNNR